MSLMGARASFAKYGKACFAAGTRLLTPEGSKGIEEFVSGDFVLSCDEHDASGEVAPRMVEEVFRTTGRILHLHVAGEVIRTTAQHPFYSHEKGWIEAELLQPNDWLLGADGNWRFTRLKVGWYGGGKRCVDTLDGTGQWYKAGKRLVPLRWVFVRDVSGTHRDEYFFTTDPRLDPTRVIGYYCGRWNIEITFQEARSCLGLESTRGWYQKTVLRAGPCLLGLYSVVAILFSTLPESKRVSTVSWPGKATVTFSDALCGVRRWLWEETILPQTGGNTALKNLPEQVPELLLTTLAPAT